MYRGEKREQSKTLESHVGETSSGLLALESRILEGWKKSNDHNTEDLTRELV